VRKPPPTGTSPRPPPTPGLRHYRLCRFNGAVPHLNARDVTFTCISRAPLDKLQAYKRRMGWTFPWASSHGSDYNFDLEISRSQEATRAFLADGVPAVATRLAQDCGTEPAAYLSETPGMSAYALEDQTVYLTYSTTARGLEFMIGYYGFLDRAPLGRNEGTRPRSGSAATTNTTTRTRPLNEPNGHRCGRRPGSPPARGDPTPGLTRLVLRHRLIVAVFWLAAAAAGYATISHTTAPLPANFSLPAVRNHRRIEVRPRRTGRIARTAKRILIRLVGIHSRN
jgi:hypothetical protein